MEINEDNKSVTKTIDRLAVDVVKYMTEQGLTLTAAESCTGGLLAAAVTSVPGASEVFPGSAVTYSEDIKMRLLGVGQDTLERYTVYSHETAREMSEGARRLFDTDYALSVTGIAGPGGALENKPVGTVYVSVSSAKRTITKELNLDKTAGRDLIRTFAVKGALELLKEELAAQSRGDRLCQ